MMEVIHLMDLLTCLKAEEPAKEVKGNLKVSQREVLLREQGPRGESGATGLWRRRTVSSSEP